MICQSNLRRGAVLDADDRRQRPRIRRGAHHHRLVASADLDLLLRQGIGSQTGGDANLVGDDGLARQRLGHVLQPCRDIDGVAERREHHVVAVADVADDHLAAVNADAEADRLVQVVAQKPVQFVDVDGNQRSRPQGLAANPARIGQERYLVSMFVDMRGSTKLAEKRLPFDTVFIVNRFLGAVSQAYQPDQAEITDQ